MQSAKAAQCNDHMHLQVDTQYTATHIALNVVEDHELWHVPVDVDYVRDTLTLLLQERYRQESNFGFPLMDGFD